MKIGGTLRYRSSRYYICLDENKSKLTWYLVTETHMDDRKAMIEGQEPSHSILDVGRLQKMKVPHGYIAEAIERVKTSGKVSVFRGKLVLNEVLQTVSMCMAYNFSPEYIEIEENWNHEGIIGKDFSAKDDRLQLRYSKRNGYYTDLSIKYEDIELEINEDLPIKFEKPKEIPFKEISDGDKKNIQVVTIKSLDYQTLKQVLDMSWYEKDGVVVKDYRPITNIQEFEELVINAMMKELEECKKRGQEFVLGLDTETTGLIFYDLSPENEELSELVAIPISWKDDQGVVVFVDMEYFNNVPLDYVLARLRHFIEGEKGHIRIEKRENFKSQNKDSAQTMTVFGTESLGYKDNDHNEVEWEVTGEHEFDREDIILTGHNILFDGRVFYHYGIESYWNDDTLQMAFDLNPKVAKGSNKLKNLTRRIFGHETPELSDLLGKGNETMYKYISDIRVATIYGCADTDYTRQVRAYLKRLMEDVSMSLGHAPDRMLKAYRKQDMRIMNRLFISEYYGMNSDQKLLGERADIVEKDLKIIREFLYNYVGWAVDYRNKLDSLRKEVEVGRITEEEFMERSKQIVPDTNQVYEFELKGSRIRDVIYNILGYPIKGYTKGKVKLPSVDKFVMKKLQSYKRATPGNTLDSDILSSDPRNATLPDDEKIVLISAKEFNKLKYPVAYVLAKYGELNKEWTSYYKPIRDQNLEGKIFKGYSLARIETRRIMNPGQTMKGDLKALIKPYSDEYYLCDFDQSQVEYRIMASLANFVAVIQKMNNPEKDYHTETASDVHKVAAHKVSKYLRKQTKGISFGVPYGLGDHKMTANLFSEVNEETLFETRKMLYDYKKANAPIIELLNSYKEQAIIPREFSAEYRKFIEVDEDTPLGMIEGLMGFYRIFDLSDMDNKKKGDIQRPAGNFPIQNFAAELFRMILMRFFDRCVEEGIADKIIWHMLIHDELLFSVHKSIHPFRLYKILYESCVVTIKGHTKYFIGINIGDTWADCKKDSNEAPLEFVRRIIKRWDAGEFRDEEYQHNVKQYVLDYKQQYIVERIGEVVKNIQSNVDSAPIDVKHLLENFTEYTVRSYVSDFFPMNSEVDGGERGDGDQVWLSKFESWVIDYFGEGKEVRYADGQLKKVYRQNNELIQLDDFGFEEEDNISESYWTFDDEEAGESQYEVYTSFDEEDYDEEEEFWKQFDTSKKDAKNFGELLVSKEPKYNHVKLLNNQLIINVNRTHHVEKVKLKLNEESDGYRVVFITPLGRDVWKKVSKNVDLSELDNLIGELK